MAEARATTGSTSLHRLLAERAPSKEIASYLDGLSGQARVEEVLSITGKGVGRLYDAVEDAPALSIEELVPANTKGTLIYEGRNSLPLFTRFQKRFTRMPDGLVIGYNHGPTAFLIGPGYFAVRAASGEGPRPKEIYFDYTAPPPPSEPAGWPPFKPNERGASRFVYMDMFDYMRRVARGVVVGKAYKNGVSQGAYFSLSRAD
jgi:hypothetical protein